MILIFSGYNQRAVIAFLRTLENNRVCNYGIVAESDHDPILKTSYKEKILYIRKEKGLDLDELCKILYQLNKWKPEEMTMIAPSTEALNRFLLKHRKMIEMYNVIIPLVDEELYIQVSDKEKFWRLCKEHGLLVPNQVGCIVRYQSPIVAKPKKYVADNGMIYTPYIIQSEVEFKLFQNRYPEQEFVYQELIYGESYYLLYFFTRDGRVQCLSQRNLAQQPNGKSIIAACLSTLHKENDIARRYADLFKEIGFKGLVMVELRKKGNDFYMIEANPRFWGPSQLFCNSGYNFFEFFLQEYGFLQDVSEKEIDFQAKYLWTGGYSGNLLEDANCVWLDGGKEIVTENIKEFLENDIYRQTDTMKIYAMEILENQKGSAINDIAYHGGVHNE